MEGRHTPKEEADGHREGFPAADTAVAEDSVEVGEGLTAPPGKGKELTRAEVLEYHGNWGKGFGIAEGSGSSY